MSQSVVSASARGHTTTRGAHQPCIQITPRSFHRHWHHWSLARPLPRWYIYYWALQAVLHISLAQCAMHTDQVGSSLFWSHSPYNVKIIHPWSASLPLLHQSFVQFYSKDCNCGPSGTLQPTWQSRDKMMAILILGVKTLGYFVLCRQ